MIIKYDKKYLDELTDIDYNSNLPLYQKTNPKKAELKKWLASKFKKGDEEFYLYKKGEKIIGAIGWKKEFLSVRKACEITYISIHKNYHREGIGTKILKFLETKIKKQGFKRIYLTTGKDHNKKAIKFYKKHGYTRYVVLKDHHNKGDHSILFRKDLR